MSDTRLIVLGAGNKYFVSDPSVLESPNILDGTDTPLTMNAVGGYNEYESFISYPFTDGKTAQDFNGPGWLSFDWSFVGNANAPKQLYDPSFLIQLESAPWGISDTITLQNASSGGVVTRSGHYSKATTLSGSASKIYVRRDYLYGTLIISNLNLTQADHETTYQTSQLSYLDMSDYDNLNPSYSSFSNFGNVRTGFYDNYDVKMALNFKGDSTIGVNSTLSAKQKRSDFVNNTLPKINKIIVFPSGITGNAFSKAVKVKGVEMVDTEFTDGVQLEITLQLVGRWASSLETLTGQTITQKTINEGDTYNELLYLKKGSYTWSGNIQNGIDSSANYTIGSSPLDADNPFNFIVIDTSNSQTIASSNVYNGAFSVPFNTNSDGFYRLSIDNRYNTDTENYWNSSDYTAGYYASNGYLTPASSKAEISTVAYYPVDPNQPTTVACWATVPANDSQWVGVVFYDASKNVVTRKAYAANTQTSTTKNYLYKINFVKSSAGGYNAIPSNAAFIRVSFRTWGNVYHLKLALNQADIVKFTPSPFEPSYYVPFSLDFELMGPQTNLPASINPPNYGTNLLTGTSNAQDQFHAITGTSPDGGGYDLVTFNKLPLEKDTDYTASFWVKTSEKADIISYLFDIGSNGNYDDGATVNQSTTDYTRFVVHFHNGNNNATPSFIPVRINKAGVTGWIYGCKLEKGTTATPWSPAPSDNVNIYPIKTISNMVDKWALALSSDTGLPNAKIEINAVDDENNAFKTGTLNVISNIPTNEIVLNNDLIEIKTGTFRFANRVITTIVASSSGVVGLSSDDMSSVIDALTPDSNGDGLPTTIKASNFATGEILQLGFYSYKTQDFI